MSKQGELNTRMDELTKSVAEDEELEGQSIVTRFLNPESRNKKANESPNKKAKCNTTGDNNNPVDIGDDSSCNDGDVSDNDS